MSFPSMQIRCVQPTTNYLPAQRSGAQRRNVPFTATVRWSARGWPSSTLLKAHNPRPCRAYPVQLTPYHKETSEQSLPTHLM